MISHYDLECREKRQERRDNCLEAAEAGETTCYRDECPDYRRECDGPKMSDLGQHIFDSLVAINRVYAGVK